MEDRTEFVQKLCSLEIPSSIKISPDQQSIVYSTELSWGHSKTPTPVSTLWLAQTGQQSSSHQLTSGRFKDYAPQWSPDGQGIAFISDRAKPGEHWAIYHLPLQKNSEASAVTPLEREKRITAFSYSPDGSCIAYISCDETSAEQRDRQKNGQDVHVWGTQWDYARLRVVNLQSKQVSQLSVDKHVTGLCWSPDGRQIGFSSHSTPDVEEPWLTGSKVSVVDLNLSQVTNICSVPKHLYNLNWPKDGILYFCAAVPENTGFGGCAIYAVDPRQPNPKHKRVSFGIEDDAIGLSTANGRLVVKVEHHLESRICLVDETVLYSVGAELECFDVGFPIDGADPVLAVAISSVNHPCEVFSKSRPAAELVQLSGHGSDFEDIKFGTCSFLNCTSGDGKVQLESVYLAPALSHDASDTAGASTPPPTVVMIHGGPNTRLTNAFNAYYYMIAPYLLRLGYALLLPDYRGSRGRGMAFEQALVKNCGMLDYADVLETTNDAIERGLADPERLFLMGFSHGGLLACLGSVRNGLNDLPLKFRAACLGASICDTDAMALTSDLGSSYPGELLGGRNPWTAGAAEPHTRSASALWEVAAAVEHTRRTGEAVIPPVLILHGEADARCPVSQAWGMRRALAHYGLPCECVTYPRQGHMFHEQAFWIDMVLRIGEWCERYLGPGVRAQRA